MTILVSERCYWEEGLYMKLNEWIQSNEHVCMFVVVCACMWVCACVFNSLSNADPDDSTVWKMLRIVEGIWSREWKTEERDRQTDSECGSRRFNEVSTWDGAAVVAAVAVAADNDGIGFWGVVGGGRRSVRDRRRRKEGHDGKSCIEMTWKLNVFIGKHLKTKSSVVDFWQILLQINLKTNLN